MDEEWDYRKLPLRSEPRAADRTTASLTFPQRRPWHHQEHNPDLRLDVDRGVGSTNAPPPTTSATTFSAARGEGVRAAVVA
jgi:hypothetical protein